VPVAAAAVVLLAGGATAAVLLARPGGGLLITPSGRHLLVGHHRSLEARLGGGDVAAQWRSSDPQVVAVGAHGQLLARTAGSATITASARGHSGSVTVQSVGIRRLRLRLPGTIGYGETARPRVVETLTDGVTPRVAPLPVRITLLRTGPLLLTGGGLLGTALGVDTVSARGPDGPPARERVQVVPAVPTNQATATPGFVPHAPLVVQIDNGPTSDPHTGLQGADIIYEYATEGGITRFTAVFWHLRPAATLGPMRSARLILIPLEQMYRGLAVFSGASNGTYGNILHDHVPILTDDCCGQDFYRTSDHVAPSNLFTQGHLLLGALAAQFPTLARESLPYRLVPPHPDPLAQGPIRTVTIDQTAANVPSYHYNPVSRTWQRWLNGTPQLDTASGAPIAVRNLVVLTATWHFVNYVEDVLGNHGIDWVLKGSGPFRAFIDGRAFQGTWHRPAQGLPLLFTLADGRPLPFATGLTWVEVVAAGTPVTTAG